MSRMEGFLFIEPHTPNVGIVMRVKGLLHREKSGFQEIEVIDTYEFDKVLLLSGKVMLTERDEYIYHEMLIHPAMLSHSSPKDIVIIGGGDGFSVREVLKYDVDRVSLVEIDERVTAVSRKIFGCPWLSDPRVKIYYEDGAKWIKKTDKADIIFVDSTDPEGSALSLAKKEFLSRCKEVLGDRGIFIAQSQSPFYDREFIKNQIKTLRSLFRSVQLYLAPIPTYPGGIWSFLIASQRSPAIFRPPPPLLKYYTSEIHTGAFALPQGLKEFLNTPL